MPLSRKNMPRYRYMFGQNGDGRPLGVDSPHLSFLVDKVGKNWGAERKAIHEKIRKDLEREFADIPKDKKAIFLSGEPGAGKSHFVQNTEGIVGNYAVIDIDSVRDRLLTELSNRNLLNLPEHPLTSPVTPRELATLYHAEARDIVKKIQTWAVNSGRNVLIDEPMTAGSSKKTVTGIRNRGYETTGVQFRCSPETAEQAIKDRYIEGANYHPLGGRLVPTKISSDAREHAPKNFERIREAGLFDRTFDSFRDGAEPRIVSSWTGLKKDTTPAKISELKFGTAAPKRAVGKPRVGIGSRPGETVAKRKVVSNDEIPQYKKAKQASLQVNQSSKNIEQGVAANRVPSPGERPLTRSMASKKVPIGTPVKKKITTPQPEDLRFRARTDIKREPKIPRPGSSSRKPTGSKTSIATPGIAKPVGKVRANIPANRTSRSGVRDTRKKVASPKAVSENALTQKAGTPVKKTASVSKKGISVLKPGSRPVAKKVAASNGRVRPLANGVAKSGGVGKVEPQGTVKKAAVPKMQVSKSPGQVSRASQPTVPKPGVNGGRNIPAGARPTPRGFTKRGIRKTTLPPQVQNTQAQKAPQSTLGKKPFGKVRPKTGRSVVGGVPKTPQPTKRTIRNNPVSKNTAPVKQVNPVSSQQPPQNQGRANPVKVAVVNKAVARVNPVKNVQATNAPVVRVNPVKAARANVVPVRINPVKPAATKATVRTNPVVAKPPTPKPPTPPTKGR